MKCKKCGAELPVEAKFCMMCGEAVSSAGDKGKMLWKDQCVEVVFTGLQLEKGENARYFVSFFMKNVSGSNVVPVLYSMVVNGRKVCNDTVMQVMDGPEIEPGTTKFCGSFIAADALGVDVDTLRSFRASVGYCPRSSGGYNWAEQYHFEEKEIHLPGKN